MIDLPEGVEHRVVVIDGREDRTVNGYTIAPHIPKVDVYDQQPDDQLLPLESFEVDRLHLSINGAEQGMPVAQDGFRCVVPPLREFVSGLEIVSEVVVQGREVAGFIDLTGGSICGQIRHHDAGVAIFTSEVSNDATLQILPLDAGPGRSIALPAKAWIIVSNVAGSKQDHDADFLLNYLISGSIPPGAPILDHSRNCPAPFSSAFPIYSIGPGCSNTQYP